MIRFVNCSCCFGLGWNHHRDGFREFADGSLGSLKKHVGWWYNLQYISMAFFNPNLGSRSWKVVGLQKSLVGLQMNIWAKIKDQKQHVGNDLLFRRPNFETSQYYCSKSMSFTKSFAPWTLPFQGLGAVRAEGATAALRGCQQLWETECCTCSCWIALKIMLCLLQRLYTEVILLILSYL